MLACYNNFTNLWQKPVDHDLSNKKVKYIVSVKPIQFEDVIGCYYNAFERKLLGNKSRSYTKTEHSSIDRWQPTHSWASRFDTFVEQSLSQSDSKLQRIELMRQIAKNITINMGSFELLKHIPIGKEIVLKYDCVWEQSELTASELRNIPPNENATHFIVGTISTWTAYFVITSLRGNDNSNLEIVANKLNKRLHSKLNQAKAEDTKPFRKRRYDDVRIDIYHDHIDDRKYVANLCRTYEDAKKFIKDMHSRRLKTTVKQMVICSLSSVDKYDELESTAAHCYQDTLVKMQYCLEKYNEFERIAYEIAKTLSLPASSSIKANNKKSTTDQYEFIENGKMKLPEMIDSLNKYSITFSDLCERATKSNLNDYHVAISNMIVLIKDFIVRIDHASRREQSEQFIIELQIEIDNAKFYNLAQIYKDELDRIEPLLLNYTSIKKALSPSDIQKNERSKRRLVLQIKLGAKLNSSDNVVAENYNQIVDIFKKIASIEKSTDSSCCLVAIEADRDAINNSRVTSVLAPVTADLFYYEAHRTIKSFDFPLYRNNTTDDIIWIPLNDVNSGSLRVEQIDKLLVAIEEIESDLSAIDNCKIRIDQINNDVLIRSWPSFLLTELRSVTELIGVEKQNIKDALKNTFVNNHVRNISINNHLHELKEKAEKLSQLLPEIVDFYREEHEFFATEKITIISSETMQPMKSYDQLVLSYRIAMNASSRPLTRLKQIDRNTQLPSTCPWFKLKSVAVENFQTLNSLLANNNSIMCVKNIFDDEQSMQDDCVEIKYLIRGNVLQESRVIQLTTNGHNYSMPIDLLHRYRLQANPRIDATTSQTLSTMNQRLNKLKIRYQNVGLAHMFEVEFKQIIDEILNEWLHAAYFHGYPSEGSKNNNQFDIKEVMAKANRSENTLTSLEGFVLSILKTAHIQFNNDNRSKNQLTLICNLTALENFDQQSSDTKEIANVVSRNYEKLIKTIKLNAVDYVISYASKSIYNEPIFTIEYLEHGQRIDQVLCNFGNYSQSIPLNLLNSGYRLFIDPIDQQSVKLIKAKAAQLSTTIDQLQNLIKKCVQMNADIVQNRLEQMSKIYDQSLKELNEYQFKWHCRCSSNDVPDLEKLIKESIHDQSMSRFIADLTNEFLEIDKFHQRLKARIPKLAPAVSWKQIEDKMGKNENMVILSLQFSKQLIDSVNFDDYKPKILIFDDELLQQFGKLHDSNQSDKIEFVFAIDTIETSCKSTIFFSKNRLLIPFCPTGSVSNFSATSIDAFTVKLSWTSSSQCAGFALQIRKNWDISYETISFKPSMREYTFGNMIPDTTYHFTLLTVIDHLSNQIELLYASGQTIKIKTDGKISIKERLQRDSTIDTQSKYKKTQILIPNRHSTPFDRTEPGIRRLSIGGDQPGGLDKLIMLIGGTGSGKTTLISAMINYLYEVEIGDSFRFRLLPENSERGDLNEALKSSDSQTKHVTMYTISNSRLPYRLHVIDTPGFGDTSGIGTDRRTSQYIGNWLKSQSKMGLNRLDAVCLVMKGTDTKLSAQISYEFQQIMSIFARDMQPNIMPMFTFCDTSEPPALHTMQDSNICSTDRYFKFNNSAIFEGSQLDGIRSLYWNYGMNSFATFFDHLKTIQPTGIDLSRQVCEQRDQLEKQVLTLQNTMQKHIKRQNTIKLEFENIRKTEIATNQNERFQYSINRRDRCKKLACDLMASVSDLSKHFETIRNCLAQLDKIACRRSCITDVSYIEMLIEREKREEDDGWEQRVDVLKQQLQIAETISTAENDKVDNLLRKYNDNPNGWLDFLIAQFPNHVDWLRQIEQQTKH